MAGEIEVRCSPDLMARLIEALEYYVASQFPPGSADCGQVAREELLNVVNRLREQGEHTGQAAYSRRMRAMVKEGVRLFFEYLDATEGGTHRHECELLREVCKGIEKSDEDLLDARNRDREAVDA